MTELEQVKLRKAMTEVCAILHRYTDTSKYGQTREFRAYNDVVMIWNTLFPDPE